VTVDVAPKPVEPKAPIRQTLTSRLQGGASAGWFPYLLVLPLALVLWGYVVQPMHSTIFESEESGGAGTNGTFYSSTRVCI
jgi:iron(III) transport system permease protein